MCSGIVSHLFQFKDSRQKKVFFALRIFCWRQFFFVYSRSIHRAHVYDQICFMSSELHCMHTYVTTYVCDALRSMGRCRGSCCKLSCSEESQCRLKIQSGVNDVHEQRNSYTMYIPIWVCTYAHAIWKFIVASMSFMSKVLKETITKYRCLQAFESLTNGEGPTISGLAFPPDVVGWWS
jgi:hypothetical protein